MPQENDQLEDLDLNWLRALSHLLETGSVTQAARRAGVGQPAMSRTLAHLRRTLNDPLLVQAGKRWQLSERAERLRPQVRHAMGAIRDVLREQTSFDPRVSEFDARFAANDHAVATLLSPWFLEAREKAPGLSVRIEPITPGSIGPLAEGELDFGISPRVEGAKLGLGQFVVRELCEDRFVCALRRGHPALRKRWDLEAFLACEHVMVTTGRPGPAAVDAALAARGLRRRIAAAVPNFLLVPLLLERTNFVATLPASLFDATGAALSMREPPLPFSSLPLYLAWHPRFTPDPRHRFIRESLFAHASRTRRASG